MHHNRVTRTSFPYNQRWRISRRMWIFLKVNHKKLEREKRMDSLNDPPYHKRYPGNFIEVSGMLALAIQATGSKYVNNTYFDTDYGTPICLDDRCSGCISNFMGDFIGPLVECNWEIKGCGGKKTGGLKTGTIRWEWLYSTGKSLKLLIHKSYYVPHGGSQILSPHNWAQY